MRPLPPSSTLFPYTTLFRSSLRCRHVSLLAEATQLLKAVQFDVILLDLNLEDSSGYDTFARVISAAPKTAILVLDRKSTRLNSSHANISYAVFCLKKKRSNE